MQFMVENTDIKINHDFPSFKTAYICTISVLLNIESPNAVLLQRFVHKHTEMYLSTKNKIVIQLRQFIFL